MIWVQTNLYQIKTNFELKITIKNQNLYFKYFKNAIEITYKKCYVRFWVNLYYSLLK